MEVEFQKTISPLYLKFLKSLNENQKIAVVLMVKGKEEESELNE